MKMLLMVQGEDGRVRCVSRSVGYDPAEILQGQLWLGDSGFYVWWTAHSKAMNAARWFLVEAESADAARRVIAGLHSRDCALMEEAHERTCDCGRILAHGARR